MRSKVIFHYSDQDTILSDIFKGKYLEVSISQCDQEIEMLVGLGEYGKFKEVNVKEAVAAAVKELKCKGLNKASFEIGLFTDRFDEEIIVNIAEGVNLAAYDFTEYKSKKKEYQVDAKYTIWDEEINSSQYEYVHKGTNIAKGVMLTRDLVNTPACDLTPVKFAEKAMEIGAENDIEVLVLDEHECRKLSMNTFLAIGESSANSPRLLVLKYLKGSEDDEIIGLVGKGITFDSGGYSLKSSMLGMKTDMAGAGAVMGTMYALAKNKVKVNVIAVMPLAENRLSNTAFFPGDVVKSMNGKTVEITNTDAEGRLVLADAITYAIREQNVSKIIDIATLTGAVVNALGNHISGVITNDKKFFKKFKKAAKQGQEQYHLFPIDDLYRKGLDSDIADIKNSGPKVAGCIVGGCFIEAFVEEIPWIHLDIAGTSRCEAPIYKYHTIGATGVGVTSLYAYCENN